ncbi:hypothetical protein AB0K60_01060 [Thermopolyspora sp. NPDC052614]|uniref:hypothetical protein n=1 Tax=Thermopolyspora sp. NPDC052614 TaxID=3155682 RepID=UPI0034496839
MAHAGVYPPRPGARFESGSSAAPPPTGITAFSTWSLSKLAAHLKQIRLVTSISRQHLSRILKAGGVF